MSAPRTPSTVRLSDEEKALFAQAAAVGGETVSNWMRRVLIEAARRSLDKRPPTDERKA
jgi:uncharacterized protein (DUF1778 family)